MTGRDLNDVLAESERERGSALLEHYFLLGACNTDLLFAFKEMYKYLILRETTLTMRQKELVLTALGVTVRERQVGHHLKKGRSLGLTHDDLADAVAVSAAVSGFPAFGFVLDHWSDELPRSIATARYLVAFESARAGMDPKLAEIIAVVCHAAQRTHAGMRLHLERAFATGASVGAVAEALSLLVMTSSIPTLTEAAGTWVEAGNAGLCPPPYRKD